MTTNADVVRDVLLNNFDTATTEIASKMNAKDQRIEGLELCFDNALKRIADLEHQLDVVTAALVKERGVPI